MMGICNAANMAAERRLSIHVEDEEVDRAMTEIFDFVSEKGDEQAPTMKDIMVELAQIKLVLTRGCLMPMAEQRRNKLEATAEDITRRLYDEVGFNDAVKTGALIGGVCSKWFQEKGFGFVTVRGMTVSVHKGSVRLRDHVRVGSRLVVQLFEDKSRGEG